MEFKKSSKEQIIVGRSVDAPEQHTYRVILKEEIDEAGNASFGLMVEVASPHEVPVDLGHLVELLSQAGFQIRWPAKIDKKRTLRKIWR